MRRATEKQRQSSEPDADGLSLDEIKRIAEEVGVNPRFVELAAEELGDDSFQATHNSVLGGASELSFKRRVRGRLGGQVMAAAASAIRHHSKGDPGHIETFGDSMQWRTSTTNATQSSVSILQDGEYCLIEASSAFAGYGILLNIVPFMMTLIGGLAWGIGGQTQLGVILLSIAAVLVVAMRFAYRGIARNIRSNSEILMDTLERLIVQSSPTSALDPSDTTGVDSSTGDATFQADEEKAPNVSQDILRDTDAYGPNDGKAEQARNRNKSWL